MKKILETERCILREFDIPDAKALFELNSDPDVMKYTGDIPFQTVEEAEAFLHNYSEYKKSGFGRWAVTLKSSGEFIGWCGLKRNEENLTDIGFRFFKRHWNQGFATEAASGSLNYGFNMLSIEEIVGRAAADNKASVKVLEKLNMKFWRSGNCKGIENSVYYRISKSQFNLTNR